MFRELGGFAKSLPRRSWVVFVAAFSLIFLIFLWHLTSLTPGLSPAEASYSRQSQTLSQIADNPINAPHKLIVFAANKSAPHHPSLVRLASVFFGLVFCLIFYRLSTSWFGRAIGAFSTLIFATLPLLVISTRQGSPEVMFFAPLVFIYLYAWLGKTTSPKSLVWLLGCLAAALFLLTPGMIIWLAAAIVICRRTLIKTLSEARPAVLAGGMVLIIAPLAWLVWAAATHHQVIKSIFLIPAHLSSATNILRDSGWMVLSLFFKTGHANPLFIDRLPILNILLLALLVFGFYAMLGATKSKTLWLSLSVGYAVMVAALNNNPVLLIFGLPALLVFVAAGLRYLYIEWRSVFPRNPVPKTFALVLIAFVATIQVYFGLRYSLAAWPNSPATRATYVLK